MSESESESDNNYFSDTDSEKEEQNKTLDELYPQDDEELMEVNKIINEHIKNIDINDLEMDYDSIAVKKKVKVRKIKEDTKKYIDLEVNDFAVKRENSKKGKWKSKRMHDKKKVNGTLKKNNVSRKFHPKLPSPLYLKLNGLQNNLDKHNFKSENFPELK